MPAGLLRRLGALLYDTLLIVALMMIATALFLPLTGGEAVSAETHPTLTVVYQLVLLSLLVAFYGYFWTRGGQTLGMAAWRLRVEREDHGLLTWPDTLRRLAWAAVSLLCAGAGLLWVAVDRERRAWHDRLSHTRVVVVPKRPRRPRP